MMSSAVLDVGSTSSDVVRLISAYTRPPPSPSALSYNSTSGGGGGGADVTDATDRCTWFHFVVNTLLIGALCVFGLLGNTLSLFVLERDRRNRVAVLLLQSLATADNLVLAVAFVELSVVYGLLPVVGCADAQLASAPYLVKYVNPVGCAVQSCAIWITVLLAVNRYVAICRPFTATRWLTMTRTRLQVRARLLGHPTGRRGCYKGEGAGEACHFPQSEVWPPLPSSPGRLS